MKKLLLIAIASLLLSVGSKGQDVIPATNGQNVIGNTTARYKSISLGNATGALGDYFQYKVGDYKYLNIGSIDWGTGYTNILGSYTTGNAASLYFIIKNHNIGCDFNGQAGLVFDVQYESSISTGDNKAVLFKSGWDKQIMWITGNGDLTVKRNIFASGNVGIGTTTPVEALEVKGNAKVGIVSIGGGESTESPRNYVNLGSNNHGTLLLSSNLFLKDGNLLIAKGHPTMSGAAIKIPGNLQTRQNFIEFWTTPVANVIDGGSYTQATPRMVIRPDGNVGIGTDNPDEMLTVKGNIHALAVLVDLKGPLADFVFAPTYNLKPLAEVEAFVKENKHLPEIPSAAEVAEKGVNLGEMQNKLLQKVEELTLYAIELEKSRNELFKSRNEEIQKRVELEARLAKIETMLLQK